MSKKKLNIDSIKGKPGFKTPDGYFDQLPGIIEARIADLEEGKEIALNADIFKRELPFTVPEGYFADLPLALSKRTESANATNWAWTKPVLAWATPVMMVLVFIGYVFLAKDTGATLTTDEMLAEISSEELIAYLEVSEMTTEELLEGVDLTLIADDFDDTEQDMLGDVETVSYTHLTLPTKRIV